MGTVIRFPIEKRMPRKDARGLRRGAESATVIVLPVIRVVRRNAGADVRAGEKPAGKDAQSV